MLGDHGYFRKCEPYEGSANIPFIIAASPDLKFTAGLRPAQPVCLEDIMPTLLELAGVPVHEQMTGKSLVNILRSEKSGYIEDRKIMLAGKERHDIGRPNDWGYPVRAIRTPEFFYSHNYNPERWPACNPETGLGNCDPGPTKSWIVDHKGEFYDLAFGYRDEEELYSLKDDPK